MQCSPLPSLNLHRNGRAAHCWSLRSGSSQKSRTPARGRSVLSQRVNHSDISFNSQANSEPGQRIWDLPVKAEVALSPSLCTDTSGSGNLCDFCNSSYVSVKDKKEVSQKMRDSLPSSEHTQLERETKSLTANSADSPGKRPAAFWSGSPQPQSSFLWGKHKSMLIFGCFWQCFGSLTTSLSNTRLKITEP